jgi:hypothetical protein
LAAQPLLDVAAGGVGVYRFAFIGVLGAITGYALAYRPEFYKHSIGPYLFSVVWSRLSAWDN